MNRIAVLGWCLFVMLCITCNTVVAEGLVKGAPIPPLDGVDITGRPVRLDELVSGPPYLVILFLFSPGTGDVLAAKLQQLQLAHGADKLRVVAVGLEQDGPALADFAKRMGIAYQIVAPEKLKDAGWLQGMTGMPMTVFVRADSQRTVDEIIQGSGASTAKLLAVLAENLFRQRKAEALPLAREAVTESPDTETRALQGYILAAEGKLDEAEKEFGEIDSNAGLAKVALQRGDTDRAVAIAEKAPGDGYALTVKATALAQQGKMDQAVAVAAEAAKQTAPGWQQSEAVNLEGRLAQQQGQTSQAIDKYSQAVALDGYNIIALSNEGAAKRDAGDLAGARTALEQATAQSKDAATALLLQQVVIEMAAANDTKRHEAVRQQIETLASRFKELKDSGALAKTDTWTTPPLVMAFLPDAGNPVFLERAGTAPVVMGELERLLRESGKANVVERAMLDKLLQELNLGSSDLAAAETQRRLGRVLSAGNLGFVSYSRIGNKLTTHLRIVDTETTEVLFQTDAPTDENDPGQAASALTRRFVDEFAAKRELKGLIADASDEKNILINLGAKHGVTPGQQFIVLTDGAPIEAGGRIVAYRQAPVGKLAVTTVEAEYAVCQAVTKRDGVTLAKEMKIKAAPAEAAP